MNTRPATAPKLPKMSTGHYEPKEGDVITVELPNERTRAIIQRIISDTAVIAKLSQYTTSRSHNYKKDDLIPCRFETLSMNQPGWKAVSERELAATEETGKRTKKKGA